jgi:hypothetical protein
LLIVARAGAQSPDADQLLRQMSSRIAAAKIFTFEATREVDPSLLEETQMREKARVSVIVQRPNKISVVATARSGTRHFIANGRTLSILDAAPNDYSVVPMHTHLDGLVEQLDKKYGFSPPLAEFALSDPYADFKKQASTARYLGRTRTFEGFLGFGGVACHRLELKGKEADAELWIAVDDQLPRKLIATFHRPGRPQVRIAFSKWNLAAQVSASAFNFSPPPGAQKIELWTPAKMQAAKN